jgi:hypothetical protein
MISEGGTWKHANGPFQFGLMMMALGRLVENSFSTFTSRER